MAKIKKFKKTATTKSNKRKSPVLSHKLQNTPFKRKTTSTNTTMTPLAIREHNKAIKLYMKHYKHGINIKNALDMSLDVDFKRNKEELSSVYSRTLTQRGIFIFTVKASGKHKFNEYGVAKDFIAKKQDVHIWWDLNKTEDMTAEEILLNAPIKFECSCGRHSYWFRYIATKVNASLGLQEHRFPQRNNKELKGLLCKHMIRTIDVIRRKSFLNTFSRYVDNYRVGKGTRLSHKDKASVGASSFRK